MKHSAAKTARSGFSERELRDSGLPPAGKLGASKEEMWALAVGLFVIAMTIAAAFIDTQL